MKICVSYNLLIFLLVMLNLIQLFYKHLNIYLLDRAPSGLPRSFSHFPILVSVHALNQMKSNSIRISDFEPEQEFGFNRSVYCIIPLSNRCFGSQIKTSSWSCALYNSFSLDLYYMKMNIAGNWTGSWVLYRGKLLTPLGGERKRESCSSFGTLRFTHST